MEGKENQRKKKNKNEIKSVRECNTENRGRYNSIDNNVHFNKSTDPFTDKMK